MLRLLGGALVLLASGSFGITAGVRYYRAARHLQAFCRAVELLRCEINYSLQPLPEVCTVVADRLTGPPAAFFRCFAAQLREPVSRDRAAAAALEAARGLQLPQDAVMAVLELCKDRRLRLAGTAEDCTVTCTGPGEETGSEATERTEN